MCRCGRLTLTSWDSRPETSVPSWTFRAPNHWIRASQGGQGPVQMVRISKMFGRRTVENHGGSWETALQEAWESVQASDILDT